MSVFMASKVKESEIWLPRFISQVEQMEGISQIAVMYAKSRDKSLAYLKHWQDTSKHPVEIYADPYLPPEDRHGAKLAAIKQDIQKLLKDSGSQYYLNLDCDLVGLPRNMVSTLMHEDKDLIAAMNWIEDRTPKQFFDTYEFRTEGCRFHPLNPPGKFDTEPFEVESVSTCYLAKAEVELAGEYRNPYPHIPFCKDLRDKGYSIWVHPGVHCTHIDLEALEFTRQPLPVASSLSPYIDHKGMKWTPEQVGAQIFNVIHLSYRINMLEKYPAIAGPAEEWMKGRPLITASYKVHPNEIDYLSYSIESIYPYVDCIDIVTGPIKLREKEAKPFKWSFRDHENKIRIIDGVWKDKQEIQNKLLEVCRSKWMLFIDADEIIQGMEHVRSFAEKNPDGTMIYARPVKFFNFYHDFNHTAYSLDPTSPWAQFGLPHPFLIHRDIPGLNFAVFHTIPMDGFGVPVHSETDQHRKAVLDDVTVYHYGAVKSKKAMKSKLSFEKNRGINYPGEVKDDPWLSGELPPHMVLEEFTGEHPVIMRSHPMFGKKRIRITETIPSYKFKVLRK